MYRASVLVRNAVRWWVSGTLMAILVLAAILLVGRLLGRNDPDATWAVSVAAAFGYPSIIMLAGGPMTAVALIGWLVLAQRFPLIENSRVLRTVGLVLVGALIAQVGLALWLVVDGEMRSIEEVVVRLRSSTDAVSFVTTGFVASVVLPRLLVARLRMPSMYFT